MKKKLVLISLFVLPVVIYLFFASGIYNFANLPLITDNVSPISSYTAQEYKVVQTAKGPLELQDHITLVAYLGDGLKNNPGYTANLNLMIFKYFERYDDFQLVLFANKGSEKVIEELKTELARIFDTSKMHFIIASKDQVEEHFASLNTNLNLMTDGGHPDVFVIDKSLSLRSGHEEKKGNKYGYDFTQAVEMGYLKDDVSPNNIMKKNTYIGIAAIVLIFGIIVIPKIYRRIANDDITRGGRMHKAGGELIEDEPGELVYINQSGVDRKVPAFEFVDQNNDTIANKDYKGKVYLVEFFFTRCTDICIPMSHNLQTIAKQFEGRDDFGIASFSIDPEHDTPEILKKYRDEYGVTNPNWHFMTGDRSEIRKLSNQGFYLATNEQGDETDLYHSGLFALIDKNGFIRSRRDPYGNPKPYYRGFVPIDAVVPEGGETPEIDILIEDIKKLLE